MDDYDSLLNRAKKASELKKPEENHQITLDEYKEAKKEEKPKEMVFHQITMYEYLNGIV